MTAISTGSCLGWTNVEYGTMLSGRNEEDSNSARKNAAAANLHGESCAGSGARYEHSRWKEVVGGVEAEAHGSFGWGARHTNIPARREINEIELDQENQSADRPQRRG